MVALFGRRSAYARFTPTHPLSLLLRFSLEHERKHSGYDESGNAYPHWDEHAVYRELPMKKEAKKMHDGNNRKYDNSNSRKRFHDLSLLYRFLEVFLFLPLFLGWQDSQ